MRAAILPCLLALAVAITPAQTRSGVSQVSTSRLAEAIAAGERGEIPVEDVMLRRIADDALPGDTAAATIAAYQSAPFVVMVTTPYTRAQSAAFIAKHQDQPRPRLTIAQMNAGLVTVVVAPSPNAATADAVEDAMLVRGDGDVEVTRPVRFSVQPVPLEDEIGGTRPGAIGRFVFPFAAFDPDLPPPTLVIVGARGAYRWAMTQDDIDRLK